MSAREGAGLGENCAVTICCLGDSITNGAGSSSGTKNAGYRYPLDLALTSMGIKAMFVGAGASGDSDVPQRFHDGVNGDTIAQATARALVSLPLRCPEVLLIHLGTNDNQTGRTAEQALTDLDLLLGKAWAYGQRPGFNRLRLILVALIADVHINKQMTRDFNAGIPALVATHVAAGENIRVVDHFTPMGANPGVNFNQSSQPHPNDTGYGVMGTTWAVALANFRR